jgi:CheY-like chemotaxis protein
VKFTEQGWVSLSVAPWHPPKGKAKGKSKGRSRGRSKGKIGVAFAVSDSGIGLTMAEIKRLFRPFTQANVTIASRFGGAGLGLSSVKQLARAMGGDVTVTTRRTRGATFTLTVALNSAEDADAAEESGEGELSNAVRSLRVLSVEDNPFGRVVLNTILTELGHQAEFIGRGEDAESRIAQGAFDAVLMDMVLPGIDGIEAIKRIRNMRPPLGHIPIIGISGRGEDEAASRAAGADAFLVKPVSPRALATALLEARRRAAAAT